MAGYYLSEDLPRFGEIGKSAGKQWEAFSAWFVNVAAVIRGGGAIAHWAQTQNTLARKRA